MCKLCLEETLGEMALAEIAEVAGPANCLGEEIALRKGNVKEVIYCAGEDTNSCGGTVRFSNFVCRVCEDWWSDCVQIAIISCEKDSEFGMPCLQLRDGCGVGGTSFRGSDVLGHGVRCQDQLVVQH